MLNVAFVDGLTFSLRKALHSYIALLMLSFMVSSICFAMHSGKSAVIHNVLVSPVNSISLMKYMSLPFSSCDMNLLLKIVALSPDCISQFCLSVSSNPCDAMYSFVIADAILLYGLLATFVIFICDMVPVWTMLFDRVSNSKCFGGIMLADALGMNILWLSSAFCAATLVAAAMQIAIVSSMRIVAFISRCTKKIYGHQANTHTQNSYSKTIAAKIMGLF